MSRIQRLAAAASLLPLTALAGCGGSGNGTAGTPAAGAAGARTQPAARSVSADELAGAALAAGDLDGYQFQDMPVPSRSGSAATPAACQPIENMRTYRLNPAPAASVARIAITTTGKAQGTATTVALSTYDRPVAEKVMADLRAAVAACGAGFSGGALKFTAVTPTAVPDAGDETVAYQLTGSGTSTNWYTVVRRGSVVVLFLAATGRSGAGKVPEDLVQAQIAKLDRATG